MSAPEADPLDDLVEELYTDRARAWEAALVTAQTFLDTIADEILDNLDRDRLNADTARIKDPARAADKIRRRIAEGRITMPQTPDDVARALSDIVGVKVLCKSPRDLTAFTEKLVEACESAHCPIDFAETPVDYVTYPKPSGYRAFHAVLVVGVATHQGMVSVKVEVQVKTRLQDAWGELTHEDMYKPGGALKPTQRHSEYATSMATLLAEVDAMADTLAGQLEELTTASGAHASGPTIRVRVVRTGPRYALAVADDGRRGLIPARSVKDAAKSRQRIKVDHYLSVGQHVNVTVDDTDDALYYNVVGPLERTKPL